MCFSFCIKFFSKNDYKRKNVTPIRRANASEECQENSDDELGAKQVKIIGCHVSRAPVPERIARLP